MPPMERISKINFREATTWESFSR